MKIAFVFPGQATQFIGMGKEIFENYKEAKDVFNFANETLNENISDLCFNGPDEELLKTSNQQPAILATEMAILQVLLDKGIKPDAVCGFSLGEYAALVCAKVISLKDALPLVRKRGLFIQEAVEEGVGKMALISGLDHEVVENVCKEASIKGVVECSNYNAPKSIVISGENEAVDYAISLCKEQRGRAIPLKVSAPFHTSLIKTAGTKLKAELEQIEINEPIYPFYPNVTGKVYSKDDSIIDLLDLHVSSPVRFESSINEMLKDGIDVFVEIGPGKSVNNNISRIVKALDKEVHLFNIQSTSEVEEFLKFIESKN